MSMSLTFLAASLTNGTNKLEYLSLESCFSHFDSKAGACPSVPLFRHLEISELAQKEIGSNALAFLSHYCRRENDRNEATYSKAKLSTYTVTKVGIHVAVACVLMTTKFARVNASLERRLFNCVEFERKKINDIIFWEATLFLCPIL